MDFSAEGQMAERKWPDLFVEELESRAEDRRRERLHEFVRSNRPEQVGQSFASQNLCATCQRPASAARPPQCHAAKEPRWRVGCMPLLDRNLSNFAFTT